MPEWEDYYEILGVDPDANQEEIKKAYRDNAFIYHPDRLHSESARHRAEEKMKKVNRAYEILSDPQKRQQYHLEWLRRKGGTGTFTEGYQVPKPKPVVDPPVIRFTNVPAKTVRTSLFIIRNEGGPYSEIWFDNPKSWVRIMNYSSLSDSEELPLKVEIIAEGEEWGKTYSEVIRVRLDNEETQVKIELRTMPEPARKKTYAGAGSTPRPQPTPSGPQPTPPSSPVRTRRRTSPYVKGFFGAVMASLLLVLIAIVGQFLPEKNTEKASRHVSETEKKHILASLDNWVKRWVQTNLHRLKEVDSCFGRYSYTHFARINRDIWVIGGIPYAESGDYCSKVFIFHSPDNGANWEIQWEKPQRDIGWAYHVELEGIQIVDRKRICVKLFVGGISPKFQMLYTADGGKNWRIHERWEPEKIKKLQF